MKKTLPSLILSGLIFYALSAQTAIAVIDFDSRGITPNEVATLTDRFRDELTKTNRYTVIERSKMEEVLKEQGFQQLGCSTDECVVEIGQLIGVQQIVGGSVGKVGNMYTISVRIIDVQSGKIIRATNYDYRGDIGKLLIVGMKKAVDQLTGGGTEDNKYAKNINPGKVTKKLTKLISTVTDIDGNVYKTIWIGNQMWMAENLKVTHYRNGDAIPNQKMNINWINTLSGAFCYYNNISNIGDTYGALYNWYAVTDSRNIAPEGWHIPSDDEWQTLVDYLGGENVAGGKLKEVGVVHWRSPNIEAANTNGFTARPGGYRTSVNGIFSSFGYSGYYWSSTESNGTYAWYKLLDYYYSDVYHGYGSKRLGFSVRCVKD